jgi:ATP-dependent Clp protease ATP-binding subunit ClpA
MSDIDRYLAAVLADAGREARAEGSSTVEAQHLLLAVAGHDDPHTSRALGAVGLDRAAVRAALDRELTASLGAVGVTLADGEVPRPRHPRAGVPPMGASLKLAVERAIRHCPRKRDMRPVHVLLGIVAAPVGTVPRALALAGVDRAALARELGGRP